MQPHPDYGRNGRLKLHFWRIVGALVAAGMLLAAVDEANKGDGTYYPQLGVYLGETKAGDVLLYAVLAVVGVLIAVWAHRALNRS